ncbi:MAG: hypothetical protein AVDCRST_MAG27-2649 [uncultured Craurococcus sp.]|uniref:Uncharacterized protein n=1 Tax=uncultured Craurococcus sp. TaxID=1135998 RepID=A0A6J4IW79_9PROT|nr:MAG: hypothetical protein AVDCRST_MAG27-2649 [uncultured Craurococcus sp.]
MHCFHRCPAQGATGSCLSIRERIAGPQAPPPDVDVTACAAAPTHARVPLTPSAPPCPS